MIIKSDIDGNILSKEGKTVLLTINKKRLNIGYIIDGHYFKEEKEKDIFRKNNSWSINYEVLKKIIDQDGTINYRTERNIYRITAEKALETGTFLHFKKSGVERKIYVPIRHWDIDGIN